VSASPTGNELFVRAYLIALALLLAIFGPIAAMRLATTAPADTGAPAPLVVAAGESRLETWNRYVDSVGTLRSTRGVALTSEASGEVRELHFASGDRVAAGQLLVVLNDSVERASRENQRAALELAELLYRRDETLLEQQSIPRSQYDRSRAAWQQARAQLAETEAVLRRKNIVAPFAGTAGIRLVELGDYVSPGTVITSLQDLEQLELDFIVPSQAALQLRPGLAVEIRADALPGQVFAGQVLAVDSRVDPGTQNLPVRARLDPGSGLLPGMFVAVRLVLEQGVEVVTVPETAVSRSVHGDTVYVISGGDGSGALQQESRVVRTGEVRDGRIAILSGLQPGLRIVTAGQNKLYRGATVRIDETVAL